MVMERRRGVLGARLRMRLLLVFLLIALVPAILLVFVGSDIIQQAVDRWFSVDVDRTERLLAEIPSGVTVVSESGIKTAGQLRSLRERGVAAVLIGESLMRAADPAAALRELLEGLDESP